MALKRIDATPTMEIKMPKTNPVWTNKDSIVEKATSVEGPSTYRDPQR